VSELINDKGALYEVLRAEADHCADLLRQGKGPVLAYPDGMHLATLLGKAADEIERLRADNQELRQIIRRAFGEMQKVGPQLMPVRDGTVDYLHE
jgi:hypothetical protein